MIASVELLGNTSRLQARSSCEVTKKIVPLLVRPEKAIPTMLPYYQNEFKLMISPAMYTALNPACSFGLYNVRSEAQHPDFRQRAAMSPHDDDVLQQTRFRHHALGGHPCAARRTGLAMMPERLCT